MSSLSHVRSVFPNILSYTDLLSGRNLSSELSAAFNDSGLGVLALSDVPNYSSARLSLLAQARSLYLLPEPSKSQLLCPESSYKVGYSNGHEVYKGQSNSSQSNFYAFYKDRRDFPNLWPASLPGLKPAFERFSALLCSTAALFLAHVDRYLEEAYPSQAIPSLQEAFVSGDRPVGSLLYYLPQEKQRQWSRWHTDHELLQGIACPLFVDENTGRTIEMKDVDYQTRLHVRTRTGEEVQVLGEPELLLIVVGESLHILSGGRFKATPHAVINDGRMGRVSRSTFVMFYPPKRDMVLECPDEREAFSGSCCVSAVRKKWKRGITFEELDRTTFA
jgi:isopenicillin N synthase-like dioxygenase